MNTVTPEFLFPAQAIATLSSTRGQDWEALVESILRSEPESNERAAFILMIVRLAGCAACQADSFRAMRGCVPCARQVVRRYQGDDQELANQYQTALGQIEGYSQSLGN